MKLYVIKQRIISSALVTIALIVMNPSYGKTLEIGIYSLCNQFAVNYICKNIEL